MIILTICLMIAVVVNLIVLAVKLSWGLIKILVNVIAFPFVLIFLLIGGLVRVALPIVIIAAVILAFTDHKKLNG